MINSNSTIVFIGDNSLEKEAAASEFVNNFVATHGSMAVDKFGGEELETSVLSNAITTMPFLSERRLVVVRDLSANKLLAESIETIIGNVADTTDLVIIESKIDKRSKYLSTIKKMTDVREFAALDGEKLVEFALERANKLEAKISRIDAIYLIDRVGQNQQMVSSELQKLALYNPIINKQNIDLLTTISPTSSIFNLIDSAFNGDLNKVLELYDEQRAQGVEPFNILGMIGWQLHILAIVKSAGNKTDADIASAAKLSPYIVRKNRVIAKRVGHAKLQDLINQTINTDKQLKTSTMDADLAIKNLLIKSCSII